MCRKLCLFSLLPFLLFSCAEPKTPKDGGDRDSHGCIGSAGYQWSELRQECLRLFEDAIRLDPQDKTLDQSTSAFILFKSPDLSDDAKIELFLPAEKKPFMLNKTSKDNSGIWKNNQYVVKQYRGRYSLEDSRGKLLYQGPAGK